jgi:hypothetical protein
LLQTIILALLLSRNLADESDCKEVFSDRANSMGKSSRTGRAAGQRCASVDKSLSDAPVNYPDATVQHTTRVALSAALGHFCRAGH